ncbi:RlmE family RNA methyltransferase [Magnetococcales bacterium HHB-1]
MARRRPSSQQWLQEHFNDPYVKAAQQQGYRSRAAFKLLEIQERFGLLKPGMMVADLGAAPGGWSQVARSIVGRAGQVIALDRLLMPEIPYVHFIQGDFLEQAVLQKMFVTLEQVVNQQNQEIKLDLVLSDMAPEMSGHKVVDQARGELLVESAHLFIIEALRPGGCAVIKLFQGAGFHSMVKESRRCFDQVKVVKPKASRGRSPEHYLVALGFNPEPCF